MQNESSSCADLDNLCSLFLIAECPVSLEMAKRLLKSTAKNDWNLICNKNVEYHNKTGRISFQICVVLTSSGSLCFYQGMVSIFLLPLDIAKESLQTENQDQRDKTEAITEDAFLNSYLSLDTNNLMKIGHQAGDMIKHCKMHSHHGDEKCDELIKGDAKVFTARYGICYMFNPTAKDGASEKLVSNYGGPSFGLELILDIEIKYFAFLNHYPTHIFAFNMFMFSYFNTMLFVSCRSLLYAKWFE